MFFLSNLQKQRKLSNQINLQHIKLGIRGFSQKVFFKKQIMVSYGPRIPYRICLLTKWKSKKAAYFWSWNVTVRSGCIIQSISLLVILSKNEQWNAFIKPIGRKFGNKYQETIRLQTCTVYKLATSHQPSICHQIKINNYTGNKKKQSINQPHVPCL